jgi:hypothetical protein
VEIKLGLLRIGDITIGAVNAEVFNPIAERLKKESPYALSENGQRRIRSTAETVRNLHLQI